MHFSTARIALAVTAAAATISLGGCWGGDDSPTPDTPSTRVPDSAGASSSAFVSYLLSLPAGDETSEPKAIDAAFSVPADETSEPRSLAGG